VLGHGLDQRLSSERALFFERLGDRDAVHRGPVVAAEAHELHRAQVDHARERAVHVEGPLHGDRARAEPLDDRADGRVEVRARLVHLVDERDPNDAVPIRLSPHGLALRLDAARAVEDSHGAVEHAQRALDLDREVHVSGGYRPGFTRMRSPALAPRATVQYVVVAAPRS
jgi:hypothetical protein